TSKPDHIIEELSKAIEIVKKGIASFTAISGTVAMQREEFIHLLKNLENLKSKRTRDSRGGPDQEEGDQGRLAKRMRG
ncbi:hypothetical protein MKW98_007913, partial [Papaver atlanticum]